MVEINNQRKAFLDTNAGVVGGTDNGRQKTRNHGYDIVGGELFTDYSDHPQTCHAKPKTQINRRRTLPASFPLVGCLPQKRLAWKTSLRKVRTLWHCSRLGHWRFTYDWSWWYPSGNRRCSNIWASLPGAGYGQFEHKADSLIAKFKEAGGTVRDWCMSRVTAIISALVICIIVCLSWAVNHYRDNAITKPSATKMPENWSYCAAITDMQMRQRDVAALDAKYTKEVSWC